MARLGRLRIEGSTFINYLAASVVEGRGGGSMTDKGLSVVRERLLHKR